MKVIHGHTLELDCVLLGRMWKVPALPAAAMASFPTALVQVSADGNQAQPHRGMLTVPTIRCWEGADITTRALPASDAGVSIFTADVESITLYVYDLTSVTKATPVYEEELDVATVMETAAVLDGGWRLNDSGYTFKHTIAGNQRLFDGGRVYRAEYLIRTAESGTIPIVVPIHTKALLSSRSQL